MRKIALMLLGIAMFGLLVVEAQVTSISGTVTSSDDGTGIPGVSVSVKGTTIGTVTNLDGVYNLDVLNDAKTLVFSFVGMRTAEKEISGSTIDVVLKADMIGVDEVMVVAYGTAKKESFTGSASTVKSDQLEKIQTSSVSKALQGMSAGVTVTSGSGQPGANATIRIRGINSFGDSSPLIVVDGFPYDGNLNSISTDDISSMTILKDASATALYGSRAANGVIMITTKKGRQGTSVLSVKATFGISDRAIPEYDRVNVPQYYEMQWEGLRNSLVATGQSLADAATGASAELIPVLGNYNAYNVPSGQVVGTDGKINTNGQLLWNDDWQEEAFVTGKRQEVVVSASGGTEKTDYFISGSLLDDAGIVKASKFQRYSIRANINSQLKDWIKVGLNVSGTMSNQNFPASSGSSYVNSFMYTRNVAPIYPVYLYDLDGQQQYDGDGNKLYDYGNEYGRSRAYSANSNPIGTIDLDTREYGRDQFTARSYIDFKLMEGLNFKAAMSTDYYNYTGLTHQNQKYGSANSFQGRSTRDNTRTLSYTANQLLTYDKIFEDHHINVLAGHENYKWKYTSLTATRTGFPFPGLVELDAAATAEGSGSYEHNYRIESYLAKVDYDYKDRYYASFNFRTDGNSRFSKDVRWGQFWGAGVSWRISEETFMQDLTWMNSLRVKGSYGEQGSDKIGTYYAYQGLFETGSNNIDYPGLLASRLATPELTWESLKSTNLGVEIKFLDRFGVNFEYYIRSNDDLLFEKPLAPSTGFTSIDANIAELQNKGYEIELSAMLLSNSNLKWNLDLNLSHNINEIKSLPQDYIISGSKRWEVGRSVYDFWIRDYAGVNSETGKSQWYYDVQELDGEGAPAFDDNGEPILTGERQTTEVFGDADRYYVGSAIPDFTGGVTNTLEFYNFDLSIFFNFGMGGKVYDASYAGLMHAGEYGNHWHADILDRWTPENTDSDIPVIDGDQDASGQSTRFLVDGDYLNFKNINLGYTLPRSLTKKIKVDALRIYMAADNVYLWSKRKGLDPQQSLSGNPGNQYSPIRTVSFGLNVKF